MSNITRRRAVMIGDSLATDIKGARRAGIDAIWVAGGIHAVEVGLTSNGHFDQLMAQKVAEAAGEFPRAVMRWLEWSSFCCLLQARHEFYLIGKY